MMRALLLGLGLALSVAGCSTASVTQAQYGASDQPRVARVACVKMTGSRLVRRGDCSYLPGNSYSRAALESTGALSTAGALARLDPGITSR